MSDYLYIKELKKYFSNYDLIRVNDFHMFYKLFNPNIKKSSVQAYIFKLKKLGVINHLSRGIYSLNKNIDSKYNNSVVITIDAIDSSQYNDFDNLFNKKIIELNEQIEKNKMIFIDENRINVKKYNLYSIYKGDEAQIVYPFKNNFGDLLLLTLSVLYPIRIRYGISIGFVDEVKTDSWKMNGPIFWNSREALNILDNIKDYSGKIIIGDSDKNEIINKIMPIINDSINRISPKQWESIKYMYSDLSLEEILENLKLNSKSSYYERLDTSGVQSIRKAFESIYNIVELGV